MQSEIDFFGPVTKVFSRTSLNLPISVEIDISQNVSGYFGKTDPSVVQHYALPVSGFVQAAKCPKLFKHFLSADNKYNFRLERNPAFFPIGSLVDKRARNFIEASSKERTEGYEALRKELKEKVELVIQAHQQKYPTTILKQKKHSKLLGNCLDAFDKFCERFKNAKNATDHFAYKDMHFQIGPIKLHGEVDLFLLNKALDSHILVDMKLQKFGSSIFDINLPEVLQILLYAYAIRKRGSSIDSLGYYFFIENELILDKMENLEAKGSWDFLENLAYELSITVDFIPRKCELCLICPIKNKCAIGKTLKPKDFTIPLQV